MVIFHTLYAHPVALLCAEESLHFGDRVACAHGRKTIYTACIYVYISNSYSPWLVPLADWADCVPFFENHHADIQSPTSTSTISK